MCTVQYFENSKHFKMPTQCDTYPIVKYFATLTHLVVKLNELILDLSLHRLAADLGDVRKVGAVGAAPTQVGFTSALLVYAPPCSHFEVKLLL